MRRIGSLALIILFITCGAATKAQTVTATVPVGSGPNSVAVNPVTNKMYVTNPNSNNVTVIDGATNTTTTVTTGAIPVAASVNTVTNTIYISNAGSSNVTVIDGATNATTTVATGANPDSLAVNPITNKIYVSNQVSGTVTVIDGATNATTTITVGAAPLPAVVNPVTNKIYVGNNHGGTVTVIDGATNATTTVTVGTGPDGLALNPVTNKIYVPNFNTNNVTVIDGATNATTTIPVGTNPFGVALNPVTNQIYIANSGSSNVTVIDGATNATTTVAAGTDPMGVAVNPVTNTIFVTNTKSNSVTVINGATNVATTVTVGAAPDGVAVNPVTDKIYVGNTNDNTVTVIDGATNTSATVAAGSEPIAAAVNPATNKIYVLNSVSNNVTVIDGATNLTTTVTDPNAVNPFAVDVNPVTNKIYVANSSSNNVTVIDGATNTTTTVTDANALAPFGVVVNPVTNKIYVANNGSANVTVIDGATNTITTITDPNANTPHPAAVNPVTNKIYVPNKASNNVTVIDGATNTTTTVTDANAGTPVGVAVNPVTNKIYVANSSSNNVTVIDGATNTTTTVTDANAGTPFAVAVNPVTNKIYVANNTSNNVTVIDGATNTTTTVTDANANGPHGAAVNPVTNKIYVTNKVSNNVTVIDGATNTTITVTDANANAPAIAAAVNPVTNKIYVANNGSNNVTVINEQQVQPIPLTTTINPLAGNQTSNPTPTFTFSATSTFAPTAPPVDALYFQFDTWQGPWIPATATPGGGFSGKAPTLSLGTHILYAYATDGQDATSIMTTIFGGCSPVTGAISAYLFDVVNQPSESLAIIMSAPSSVQLGTGLTYLIQVTAGSTTATNLTVTDTLPDGLSATSLSSGCTGTTSITCTIASIPAGQTVSLGISVVPTAVGSLSNTATLTGVGSSGPVTTDVITTGVPLVVEVDSVNAADFVTTSPSNGDCTTAQIICTSFFPSGTSVVLTANGPGFEGWSVNSNSATCPGTGTCTLTVTSTLQTVAAVYGSVGFFSTAFGDAVVGVPYAKDISQSTLGGIPPYTFSIASGNLPTGLALSGRVISGTPATGGACPAAAALPVTCSFAVKVTDSTNLSATVNTSITIISPPNVPAQLPRLKGQYAVLFRGVSDADASLRDFVGSLAFDGGTTTPGTGTITSGTIDTNGNGSSPVAATISVSGTYTIGPDNRGLAFLQTVAGAPFGVFAFSVGDVYQGVAYTAHFIRFDDNTGSGTRGAGLMKRQVPSAFTATSFAGTYVISGTGQDTTFNRLTELGLISPNATATFTSLTTDINDNGVLSTDTLVSGTYGTDGANGAISPVGRTQIVLNLTQTTNGVNQAVTSNIAVYIVDANTLFKMKIDSGATHPVFAGMDERQFAPAGGFTTTSITGPDVLSEEGPSGLFSSSNSQVLLGLATTSVVSGTPTVSVTYDSNNDKTVAIQQTVSAPYAMAGNGRGTLNFTSAVPSPFISSQVILYLSRPDHGLVMGSGADPGFGTIGLQTGGPFLSTSFAGNYFYGDREPATPSGGPVESGVASVSGTALSFTQDANHERGTLDYGEMGTYGVAVSPLGWVTFTRNQGEEIDNDVELIITPNRVVVSEIDPSEHHPNVTDAGTIMMSPGAPSPTSFTVPAFGTVAIGSSAQSAPITVTNIGDGLLSFTGVTNATDFSIAVAPGSCLTSPPLILIQQGTCTVIVTFAPAASTPPGPTGNETLTLQTDAGNITLTASGTVALGSATHFAVSGPASATAGTAFNFTVTAQDASNNTVTSYTGTVHFASSDAAATLPANAMLTNGVGTFAATLSTVGSQTITATDTVTASITGTSNGIAVSAAPTIVLTVNVTGPGTVTSNPIGILCPSTCFANFASGSQVKLTAMANSGPTFASFSSNCTPANPQTTPPTCTLTTTTAPETVTVTFSSGGGGLTITPGTLPAGAIGASYGQTLQVSGGIAPFHFTISTGTLPAGLNLGATTGTIAGVPTGPAGTSIVTVTVTDSSLPTPLTGTAVFAVAIGAADSSNNSELNGSYAFLFHGFNDSDGTMVVVAGSFVADGHGNILPGGFEDADGAGSTGTEPPQELSGGTYTIGADNRGSLSLTTSSGTTVFAISVGGIQAGVATKARMIRFDDVSGTSGHTGSGVILKQDPLIFALAAIKGSYAFGETGSNLTNGNPESGVGFLNSDGNGNFTPAGLVNLNGGGGTGPSEALSGTYALTSETVSSGRLSASVTVTNVNGTVSDVVYIVSSSEFIFISINTTQNTVYSGIAQLQVPPAGGFGLGSLNGSGIVAVQGKQADGTSVVLVGNAALDGKGNFTLAFDQNQAGTLLTSTATGTYTVASNGQAAVTFTTGGLSNAVLYLDAANQGFLGVSDTAASEGFIEPGGNNFSNATLSGNYFLGTLDPTEIQVSDALGVASFDGVGTLQTTTDDSNPGSLRGDKQLSTPYNIASNGRLTFTATQPVVGYVASSCEAEAITTNGANPGLASVECQVIQAALTVTEAGTGTGTVTSNPTGINCPTTCSASFESGSQVVLTATAGTGSTFTSFSANCVPANPQTSPPSCTVSTATSGVTVTATFTQSAAGTILISPQTLPFGIEGLGSTSSPETLTVSNTGNTAVTFTSIAMSGDFAGATLAQCPSIAVDAEPCTFQITFTPTAAGVRSGTITFTDNATGSPQTVTLTGTGVAVAIGIAPTSLTFGSQAVGTTSAAQTVTVSNNGNFPLIFSSIVTSGDFAGATLGQCPSIGEENPPCVFSITFKPTATGTRTGAITFTDTGTGSPQTVTLTGTGTPGTATVTVTPSSLAFGSQALTTTSAPLSVTVTNTSSGPVNFAGFTTSGEDAEDFGVPLPNSSAGCSPTGTLAAGASCTINVLFTPQAAGTRTATLLIADNATGSPQTVALSGTGVSSSVIITVAPGGSTTATTVSGGTAYYGLMITGAPGVTGTVQLGCVPSSVLITCKVIPGSVTLNGSSVEVAFAIQTFCQGATTSTGFAPPIGGIGGGLGLLLATMMLALGGLVWTFRRNRRVALTFATLLLVALGSAACNSLPSGPNGATPAGTYSLSLTTTLNGQTQTLNNFLTLVVK